MTYKVYDKPGVRLLHGECVIWIPNNSTVGVASNTKEGIDPIPVIGCFVMSHISHQRDETHWHG
jgi:hypothetical protein